MCLTSLRVAIFLGISAFSLAHGQAQNSVQLSESQARLRFANEAVKGISNEIVVQGSKEKQELQAKETALTNAITTAGQNARRRKLEREQESARLGSVHKSGGAASMSIEEIDRNMDVFAQRDAERTQQESEESAKIMKLKREKQEAELKTGLRERGRLEIADLQAKISAWHTNPSEEGWNDISDQITLISAQQGRKATLRIATKNPGAFIRYQTKGERRRQKPPHSADHPTNECTEFMPYGEYFIWAERAGQPTSAKDAAYEIFVENKSIELEELP
ncbi:MAG: hypothetical protein QOJ64_649 [Acidobacteriota bacterium]|jgi:hypothetical protein|nr:hypothetical protein [Acidobacteriota bacterium]